MPTSTVEIANSALAKIGAASILSMDDDTKEAKLCKLRYDPVRRIVLRMHPWNCAIKRVTLAPLIAVPAFSFSKQFQLPADCLRLVGVYPREVFYRLEGRNILADETALQIRYLFDLRESTQMDELLGEAIACYLSWDIAYALTQSASARDFAWKQFEVVRRQAKSIDAQEERDYELTADTFVDARIQGTGALRNGDQQEL